MPPAHVGWGGVSPGCKLYVNMSRARSSWGVAAGGSLHVTTSYIIYGLNADRDRCVYSYTLDEVIAETHEFWKTFASTGQKTV